MRVHFAKAKDAHDASKFTHFNNEKVCENFMGQSEEDYSEDDSKHYPMSSTRRSLGVAMC